MPQIVDPNTMMFRNWEPKLKNRFTFEVDGIPTYLIKKAGRPKMTVSKVAIPHINNERYSAGKWKWDPISVELYDPITPSGMQLVMEWVRTSSESATGRAGYLSMYQRNATLNILGPVGDIVENWTLWGCWVESFDAGEFDWSEEATLSTITLNLAYNYSILNF